MYCLKCGKDTKSEQVFCDSCLQTMDAYPVKSDTPIHLPHRNSQPAPKKQSHRKRVIPPEEQILQLRVTIRRLILVILGLAVALGVCIGSLVYQLLTPETEKAPDTGRNYTYSPD